MNGLTRLLRRGDWVVLVCATVLVLSLFPAIWGAPAAGRQAVIHAPGGTQRIVDLDRPMALSVPGRNGDSRLQVAGGAIRFVDSPCRGHQCTLAGWLKRAGDFAACLPNGVSVEVIGGKHFDSIAF